ncbi:hypothetical protein N9C56_06290 [Paracoccaceae bacterium]|nr:hypothetical protein [Paracoccaceae bacterium]
MSAVNHLSKTAWLEKVCFWELLMIIGQLEGNTGFGINDYIDKMETRKVTRLTVQRFIKSRIMEGDLIEIKGTKKSRKTLVLSQNLMNTLDVYFGELSI